MGAFEKIQQILRDLTADGKSIEDQVYAAIAVALSRMGKVTEVKELVADLDKAGMCLSNEVWAFCRRPRSIASCSAGQRDRALFKAHCVLSHKPGPTPLHSPPPLR